MSASADLRAQLAAVISTQRHPSHGYNDGPASSSASPHDHNIDPAIGGPGHPGSGGMMSTGGDGSGDDSLGDGRKGGKRELSQSKRAAQNRAAQVRRIDRVVMGEMNVSSARWSFPEVGSYLVKLVTGLLALSILMSSIPRPRSLRKQFSLQRAFRQRKEGYIKKLEEQVREMHALDENFKAIQSENYSLREYIIHLQSRLIESQGEFPQPPPNVDLRHPHARQPQQQQQEHMEQPARHEGAPVAPMASMSQLNASAARNIAAAGLNSGKHPAPEEQGGYDHKRYKDNTTDEAADEEIIRSQLQAGADGIPTSMSV
ncbi:putative transcription factor kapC [Lachnellula arida]|uniref:Putative transcription factor kapC n=1 Tax=Lachnellula arida TaxID=1316785 RepID=A0A8T9BKS1_9HELO|nr:putative transcription factor kapC [Lachnellula arida]